MRRIILYFERLGNANRPSGTNNSAGSAKPRDAIAVTILQMIISAGMQPNFRICRCKNYFPEGLVALGLAFAATGKGRCASRADSSIVRDFVFT